MNNKEGTVLSSQMFAFPTVPMQQRIWSVNSTGDPDPAWNIAVRFKISGTLSIPQLQEALDLVVAGTEVLRTHFGWIDGELKQLVSESSSIPLRHMDYSDSENFERDLLFLSSREAETVMDLERHPLLRVAIVRRHHKEHYLLITAHHAIMDGYSVGLLSDALMDAYKGVDAQAGTRFQSASTLQFADYTLWLAEYRKSLEYLSHASFWKSTLHNHGGVKLTASQSRPKGRGHIESVLLPRLLTDAAQKISQQLNATFPQMALAIFACTANKLNDCIGIPVACRTELQLETVIGPFVNYVPLVIRASPGDTFQQFLSAVAEISHEGLSHSEFRYEDILAMKGLACNSLFDSVFICQRDFVRPRQGGGVELTPIPSVSPGALHELTVFLVERSDGWRLSCETDDRSAPAHGIAILERYQALLQAVCDDPGVSVAALTEQPSVASGALVSQGESAAIASPLTSFRMSPTQERYWALDRIDPGNNRLNLHIRYEVEGVLDEVAFKAALQALAMRHALLRTSFSGENNDLRQHVNPEVQLPLRDHSEPEGILATDTIVDLLEQERRRPFNMERGPLWSVLVIASGERKFLSITLSHIICDGWSCGILMRELVSIYDAMVAGRQAVLCPLPLSFGDLAEKSLAEEHASSLEERLAYWDELLQRPSPLLRLPTDRDEATLAPSLLEIRIIDPILSEAVAQMAKDQGVTAATVYAAAYRAVLLKYTDSTDLLIASPSANRSPESKDIVGPFADTLLLRADIGLTFEDALQATQHALLSAVEHLVPLQYMMERVRRHDAESGVAIQLGFMYQEAFVHDLVAEHLTLRTMTNPIAESSFNWHLAVIDRSGEISLEFTAPQSQMSPELAAIILEDFELSLSGYVVAPRKLLVKIAGSTQRVKEICRHAQSGRQAPPLNATPAPERRLVAASPEETEKMVQVWQAVFRRLQITRHHDFFALGGHSLLLARLQVAIEKQFGYRIFAADIVAAPTCELLIERMTGGRQNDTHAHSRIIPLQAEGEEVPLFVISQSLIVRELADELKPNQPTFTIQFTHEDVDHLGSDATMQQVAKLYIEHLRAVRPVGPYRLGGWCVSGWVAYEMAQQLSAAGEDVQLLLILDAWAPNFWRDLHGLTRAFGRAFYYMHRVSFIASQLFSSNQAAVPLATRLRALWLPILARLHIAWEHLSPRKAEPFSTEVTAFDQMMESATTSYRALPYDDDRVLVFRSSEQPRGGNLPDDMGWHRYLPKAVGVISLPGDHTGMFSGPGATLMAKCILDKVAGHPSSTLPNSTLPTNSSDLLNVSSWSL